MSSRVCPHCSQAVVSQRPTSQLICPTCGTPFALPRPNQWTLLIVPILSVVHYVNFVF